jgi:hypothetical protein
MCDDHALGWNGGVLNRGHRVTGHYYLEGARPGVAERYPVAFDNPDTKAKEIYSGFSLAGILQKFCPATCAPLRPGSRPVYVVVGSSQGDLIIAPLSKIFAAADEQRVIIADTKGAMALPNNELRAFLIENDRVVESARSIFGARLVTTH